MMRRSSLALAALLVAALFGACSTLEEPETQDIVSTIPWGDSETYTYDLYDDDELIGETTLTVEREGDTFLLAQRSSDDEGNVDMAEVVVDAETLKPRSGTRTIIDADRKEVAASVYEEISTDECDAGIVVRIEEQVFDPPDEATPDVPRRNPLCVPEHAYDNDTSLFIWRTVAFDRSFLANYKSVLTGTRRIQTVRIEVISRTTETPVGEIDAWLVQISADGKNQRAWFAASDDHRLLAYQNEGFTFELRE